jgi:glycosyltransferase involved in cell wall biosynthesis
MISVSIVLIAYNYEKYIARAIESIKRLSGKFKRDIIIIDNGSTDNTLQEIKKNYIDLPKVTLLSEAGFSLSHAVNNAIFLAQGDYICFLNGDEMLHPESINIMLDILIETKLEFALGYRTYMDPQKVKNPHSLDKQNFDIIGNPIIDILTNKKYSKVGFASGGAFIKRSLFEKVSGADNGCYYADMSLGLRCAKYSALAFVNDVICYKQTKEQNIDKHSLAFDNLQAAANFINNHPDIAEPFVRYFLKFLYRTIWSLDKTKLYTALKILVHKYKLQKQTLVQLKLTYSQELKKLR